MVLLAWVFFVMSMAALVVSVFGPLGYIGMTERTSTVPFQRGLMAWWLTPFSSFLLLTWVLSNFGGAEKLLSPAWFNAYLAALYGLAFLGFVIVLRGIALGPIRQPEKES